MKFDNTEVFNFKGAFRGMRNPMNSWDKSDSKFIYDEDSFIVGVKDLELAQRLIKGGSEHSKFMRQIFVSVDITAPLYWYKEFDTYKIGTTANSTSTMHKLKDTPITKDCFECDSIVETYGGNGDLNGKPIVDIMCNLLENYRLEYLRSGDKRVWKALIQLLPSSWLQTRTVTMSYSNIQNIYRQRENHKLTEWSINFMNWIDSLPYADELIKLK